MSRGRTNPFGDAADAAANKSLELRPATRRKDWRELDPSQWSKSQRKKAARTKAGLKPHSGKKTARGTANPLTEVRRKQRTLDRLDKKEEAERVRLLKKQPKPEGLQGVVHRQKEKIRKAYLAETARTKQHRGNSRAIQARLR